MYISADFYDMICIDIHTGTDRHEALATPKNAQHIYYTDKTTRCVIRSSRGKGVVVGREDKFFNQSICQQLFLYPYVPIMGLWCGDDCWWYCC